MKYDDELTLEGLVAAHPNTERGCCAECHTEEDLIVVEHETPGTGRQPTVLCPEHAFWCISCLDRVGVVQPLDEWHGWLECLECFAGRIALRKAEAVSAVAEARTG